jgi:hypothetical protein
LSCTVNRLSSAPLARRKAKTGARWLEEEPIAGVFLDRKLLVQLFEVVFVCHAHLRSVAASEIHAIDTRWSDCRRQPPASGLVS